MRPEDTREHCAVLNHFLQVLGSEVISQVSQRNKEDADVLLCHPEGFTYTVSSYEAVSAVRAVLAMMICEDSR